MYIIICYLKLLNHKIQNIGYIILFIIIIYIHKTWNCNQQPVKRYTWSVEKFCKLPTKHVVFILTNFNEFLHLLVFVSHNWQIIGSYDILVKP